MNSNRIIDSHGLRSAFGMNLINQVANLNKVKKLYFTMRVNLWNAKAKKFLPRKGLLPFQRGVCYSANNIQALFSDLKASHGLCSL